MGESRTHLVLTVITQVISPDEESDHFPVILKVHPWLLFEAFHQQLGLAWHVTERGKHSHSHTGT